MQYNLCRHLKTNGTQCGSPALAEQPYCFFHNRLHRQHAGFRHTPETRGYIVPGQHIQLAPLEDRESVQVALSMVINALALGQLETRRATAILYGLQLASSNAGSLTLQPFASKVVRAFDSTPDDLALAQPGATVEILTPAELEEDYEAIYGDDDDDEDNEDDDYPTSHTLENSNQEDA